MRYILSVIFQFLEENYFSNTLDGQYDHLDFSGTNTTLLFVVGGLCVGVLIASFMMYYQSNVAGAFARKLLSDKIFSEKDAKTLSELGFEKSEAVKREMRSRSSVLRKLVSYEEDGTVYDYRTELALRLGIPVEKLDELVKEEEKRRAEKSLTARLGRLLHGKKGGDAATEQNGIAEILPTDDAATDAQEPVTENERFDEAKTENAGHSPTESAEAEAEDGALSATEAEGSESDLPTAKKPSAKAFFGRIFGKSAVLSVRVPNFEKARFFIPEELSYRASLRYEKKKVTPLALILTFLCVLVFFFLALRLIPVFVSMLDTSIGNVIGGL